MTTHAAAYPLGPSVRSPWRTFCGRELRPWRLSDTPEEATCKTCRRVLARERR